MNGNCDICGRYCDKLICSFGEHLCNKHYNQYKKFGKFLDSNPRTIYDRNDYTIDGDITYIYLYNKDCERVGTAIIDTEDLDKVKDIKWKLSKSGYAMNTAKGGSGRPNLHMSRVIYGEDKLTPELFVDHINHNTLDNRKVNLRAVTKSENAMNSIRMGNSDGNTFQGVTKYANSYNATIKYHQKTFNLGAFATFEEAVFARWIAEIALFRDFRYNKDCPVSIPENAFSIIKLVVNNIVNGGITSEGNIFKDYVLENNDDDYESFL